MVPGKMLPIVLSEFHDSAGHYGQTKTLNLVACRFWFTGMKKQVFAYVA